MTLSAGTQFGRYEIRSQLGVGGTGEVYRAVKMTIEQVMGESVLMRFDLNQLSGMTSVPSAVADGS